MITTKQNWTPINEANICRDDCIFVKHENGSFNAVFVFIDGCFSDYGKNGAVTHVYQPDFSNGAPEGWISRDEAKPEKGTVVFVHRKGGEKYYRMDIDYYKGEGKFLLEKYEDRGTIDYWTAIPEQDGKGMEIEKAG